jgi:hypothetical protein
MASPTTCWRWFPSGLFATATLVSQTGHIRKSEWALCAAECDARGKAVVSISWGHVEAGRTQDLICANCVSNPLIHDILSSALHFRFNFK